MSNLTDAQYNRLLRKAAKATAIASELINQCAAEFKERYGYDPNADGIIDKLNLHGSDDCSLKQFHATMIGKDE